MTKGIKSEIPKFEFQAYRYFPPKEKKKPKYIKQMIFWYSLVILLWVISEIFNVYEIKLLAFFIFSGCMLRVGFSEMFLDPVIGRLGDRIFIDSKSIRYLEYIYYLDQLKLKSIKTGDYFKRKKFHWSKYWFTKTYRFTFEPNLSRGTDNYLKFTYKDKDCIIYFALDSKEHMQQFDNLMGFLFKEEILDYEEDLNYSRLNSYAEIQTINKNYFQDFKL